VQHCRENCAPQHAQHGGDALVRAGTAKGERTRLEQSHVLVVVVVALENGLAGSLEVRDLAVNGRAREEKAPELVGH